MSVTRDEIIAQVEDVLDTLTALVAESGEHLTCSELESLCRLAEMIGRDDWAEGARRCHAESDEEGDLHYEPEDDPEDDERGPEPW